jgi:thiol-disulfide isomerase/thioredoxin
MGIFGNDNEPKTITDSEIMELKKKHGIVLFYMNGCGHCETMKPSWNKLITELKDKHKNEIILAAIESSSMDMFKTHGINPAVSGFPTILYFQPGRHNMPEHYKGDRSYEDLKKWILTKKGKGKGKKVSNESLVILTNNTNNANNTNNTNNKNNIDTSNKKTKIKNGVGTGMGVGKTKGVAFSQFGGGGVRGKTKKRRHMKRRRSHKRRVTSVRKNSRRRVRR